MTTDYVQLLLTVVLIISTILLVVIGIQVITILKELRTILGRANNLVTNIERVGFSLDSGVKELGGFFAGFKTVVGVVDALTKAKKRKGTA